MTLPNLENPMNSSEPLWTLPDLKEYRDDNRKDDGTVISLEQAVEDMGPRYFTSIEKATIAYRLAQKELDYAEKTISRLELDFSKAWAEVRRLLSDNTELRARVLDVSEKENEQFQAKWDALTKLDDANDKLEAQGEYINELVADHADMLSCLKVIENCTVKTLDNLEL